MNSYIYDFHEKIDLNRLLGPFLAAHEAIIRFDERLRRSHLREAFLNRLLFQEACAAQLAEGDLVHLEELLLFDRHLSRGQPSMALSSARQILRTWRQAGNANARDLLTSTRPGEDARPIMDGDSDIDDDSHLVRPDAGALAEWHRVRRASERLPPLIAAAVVWDTWLTLNPEPMGAWRAPLLAALTLRARGTTTSLLLPIDSGRRFARYRRHPNHGLHDRIIGFTSWAETAAINADKALSTLALAEARLSRRLIGRRKSSHMADLVALFLSHPLVTVPMAARALGVSSQAVEGMLRTLQDVIVEVTDRQRCRAWRLA